MSILEKHLKSISSKIDLSTPKKSTFNNTGEAIPFTRHVTTDASHQDIFDHLKSMGYTKTKGYDPKPNTWSTTSNQENMNIISSPVHHKDGIHVHIEKEHGGKTKIHFEVNMSNKIRNIIREAVSENPANLKKIVQEELKSRILEAIDEKRLDEISKSALVSYIEKAASRATGTKFQAIAHTKRTFEGGADVDAHEMMADKLHRRYNNRIKGISKAVDRLVKEESDQLNEVMRITSGQNVNHCDRSEKFAKEYVKAEKYGWMDFPTEKHERDSEKFNDTYSSKSVKHGFGGSGITDYSHKTTGEKFRVERTPNAKGFHGTDHNVRKLDE